MLYVLEQAFQEEEESQSQNSIQHFGAKIKTHFLEK